MAITQDQQTDILEIVAGLFNAAPGRAYMTELANIYESVGSDTEQLADVLDDTPLFQSEVLLGRVTTESQVAVLMDHFGLVADDDPASAGSQAEAYFTQKLEAGEEFGKIVFDAVTYLNGTPAPEFADTKALLDNKVQVARIYSADHTSFDFSELQSVLSGVSATFPITQADAEEYLDSIGQGDNPGVTSELTFGADNLVGGAGNDTVTAGVVNNGAGVLVNSLEDVDRVDGGGGRDTLNATLNAAGTTTPSLNSVEIINIRNVGAGATVNFSDTTGAEQIWNNATTAALTLTYADAPIDATFGIRNTRSATDISILDDLTGGEDTLALAVTGAGIETDTAVVQSAADAAAIEALSIAATGENFVDVSAFTAITDLTVTGAGSLDAVVDTTALETVDASGNSGGVTLDLGGSGDLTVTGGTGDDSFAFDEGDIDDGDTLDGGEGTDRLSISAVQADLNELDADLQTGFEILELTAPVLVPPAVPAASTFDNEGLGYTTLAIVDDLGATGDLTVENFSGGTIEVQDNQANDINVGSVGATDSVNVAVNAEAATTLALLDVTDVETVNVSTTADTDDTTFTAIETDGVTAMTFAGAGDIIITDLNDADATNNAATKIAAIDLTAQTGGFELTTNNLGYGTTFRLGNLGETATATFDFDGVAGVDDASELDATTGFRDIFEFTTAFDGNVAITAGEFGGDVTDDRIDLSALGLAGIDDLTFTDIADVDPVTAGAQTGVLITSDASEGQILLVGVLGAAVNANDFVF